MDYDDMKIWNKKFSDCSDKILSNCVMSSAQRAGVFHDKLLSLILGALVLLDSTAGLEDAADFLCKNASSDWPLPCRNSAQEQISKYVFGGTFPIVAWWPPTIPVRGEDPAQFNAYVAANFNMVMPSDRSSDRCDPTNSSADWQASWAYIQDSIKFAWMHNLSSLVDSYRCLPWGPPNVTSGGSAQGPTATFISTTYKHKITLPEIQWLAPRLAAIPGSAGILITDDGADLVMNEVAETQWMVANTPSLFPWINQCADGSEWLARAGTPYAVPELYSIQSHPGVTGRPAAVAMAQQQLGTYRTWIRDSLRFGLQFWPLLGVGDGGDVVDLVSSSLARFQAFAAVAYGARGLNWYCFGNGLWNFTTQAPTGIYSTVADVNKRLGHGMLAAAVVQHSEWQGVISSGWAVADGWPLTPSNTSSTASNLIAGLSDDLLVGVLTDPSLPSGAAGQAITVLLVVVDMRVDTTPAAAVSRTVNLAFHDGMVTHVDVLGDGSSTGVQASVTLGGGDGVGILLHGNQDLLVAAQRLRRWGYAGVVPSMDNVWTTQYQFYNYLYKDRAQTTTLLANTLAPPSPASPAAVTGLGADGFNLVLLADHAVPSPQQPLDVALAAVLNNAMRGGLGVAVGVALNPEAEASIAHWAAAVGCHPNFAGFVLDLGTDIDTTNVTQLAHLQNATHAALQATPHAFAIATTASASAVIDVMLMEPVSTPLVALSIPPRVAVHAGCVPAQMWNGSIASAHACQGAIVSELENLSQSLVALNRRSGMASHGGGYNLFTMVDPCAVQTRSLAQFQTYMTVLHGAAGVLYRPFTACGIPGLDAAIHTANARLTAWSDKLGVTHTALRQLVSSTSWSVPGAIPPSVTGASGVVHALPADVIVGILDPVRHGEVNVSAAPPMLFVIDARVEDTSASTRRIPVTLDAATVAGWTPLVGDAEAGFPSCAKFVLGHTALVHLEPGEGMLLGLTMLQPPTDAAPSGSQWVPQRKRVGQGKS
eukprot:m.1273087 g.1273087  ORF g.1273087 m.1273087 type:complete len:991 (+) comp24751_c0_seq59:115-3087(+)